MNDEWRLLDTGVLTGAENMALDDAILECRAQGRTPNTLRFLQFNPATVLVGYHQSVKQEVRVEYCRRNGVDINRRITGGGTILFTPTCLGWEIYADKSAPGIRELRWDLDRLARKVCQGAVAGIRRLGVEAEFRPKNDIEVGGRKISGTGGTERGDAFMYQGTLLIDFDVDLMLKTLRIPVEKLKDKEIDSVKQRVTCLKWELGEVPPLQRIKRSLVEGFAEVFQAEFREEELYECETELLKERLPYFRSEEWVHLIEPPEWTQGQVTALRKTPGGLVRVSIALNIQGNFIVSALITGDFQVFPQRAIMDLEARLKNLSADEESIREAVYDFFQETETRIFGVEPDDLVQIILEAVKKKAFHVIGLNLEEADHIMTVNFMPDELLEQYFDYVLLPYCAKLVDCDYRWIEGCDACGGCTISPVYALCETLGIPVRTIQNFEHLIETINEFKERGARGYIGSCCQGFYTKHHDDFVDTEVPALLVDVDDSTCYELGEEQEAYIGQFEGQTSLKDDLMVKIIRELHRRGRIGGVKFD